MASSQGSVGDWSCLIYIAVFIEKATVCRGYTADGAGVHEDRLHPDPPKQTRSLESQAENSSFGARLCLFKVKLQLN